MKEPPIETFLVKNTGVLGWARFQAPKDSIYEVSFPQTDSGRRRWACPPRSSTLTTLLKTRDTQKSNTQGLECKAKKKKKKMQRKATEIRGGVGRSISTFLATGKCKPLPGPLLRESCISNCIYCPQRQYEAMKRALAHQPLLDPHSPMVGLRWLPSVHLCFLPSLSSCTCCPGASVLQSSRELLETDNERSGAK